MDPAAKKKAAALAACQEVRSGMVLGLGTGSTVQFALEEIARRMRQGMQILGVPTSVRTEQEARRLAIPLTTLDEHPELDLTIDGADEVDPQLNLIKGGGGALVREKIVARASKRMLVIADDAKLVQTLGTTFPVPVEVLPFAAHPVRRSLQAMGATATLRQKDGKPFVTDNNAWIVDARFARLQDPEWFEDHITLLAGVLECGIFTGLASAAFLGGPDGVRRIEPSAATSSTTNNRPPSKSF